MKNLKGILIHLGNAFWATRSAALPTIIYNPRFTEVLPEESGDENRE